MTASLHPFAILCNQGVPVGKADFDAYNAYER